MAIPTFQDLTLPTLKLCGDGTEHTKRDLLPILARDFQLTKEEIDERLDSGRQRRFDNRTAWAISYLTNSGLLERTGRGKFRITPRGTDVLKDPPERIDIKYLNQFEDFRAWRSGGEKEDEPEKVPEEAQSLSTPTEVMDAAYRQYRKALASEILERVRAASPGFFESLVVDLLIKMGYGGSRSESGQVLGGAGDGGVDGVIKEDKLGLDLIYVQAKRWDGPVGRPIVQAFVGSLEGERAQRGIIMTTSRFSGDAKEYVNEIGKRIVLIDGPTLATFMIDHGVGVTTTDSYVLSRIDSDYFDEDA